VQYHMIVDRTFETLYLNKDDAALMKKIFHIISSDDS